MRRFPARRGALVVVACVMVTGGCSSSPLADRHPSPATTTTASSADRAATAAVVAWQDGWNRSISGKSSIAFRKTFSAKCSVCAGNAETLDRYLGGGGHVSGGRYSVRSLKVSQRKPAEIVVDGVLSMSASKVMSGKVLVDRKKGFTERVSWKVVLEDGRWLVANLGETL